MLTDEKQVRVQWSMRRSYNSKPSKSSVHQRSILCFLVRLAHTSDKPVYHSFWKGILIFCQYTCPKTNVAFYLKASKFCLDSYQHYWCVKLYGIRLQRLPFAISRGYFTNTVYFYPWTATPCQPRGLSTQSSYLSNLLLTRETINQIGLSDKTEAFGWWDAENNNIDHFPNVSIVMRCLVTKSLFGHPGMQI